MQLYKHLKRVKKTGRLLITEQWSLDNIRDGIMYYVEINNKFPTAHDIDKFEYLPSSRQIQRRFGGLEKVRELLNLGGPNNFTKGSYRSEVAKNTFKRASDYEERFYYQLTKLIPEVRVHEQHRMRPAKASVDFFIYTNSFSGIGLDLFYAENILNMQNVINIKIKTYKEVITPLIFIIIDNDSINEIDIQNSISNRKVSLPANISIITSSEFLKNIKKIIKLDSINIVSGYTN